jgi:hypothetical protein
MREILISAVNDLGTRVLELGGARTAQGDVEGVRQYWPLIRSPITPFAFSFAALGIANRQTAEEPSVPARIVWQVTKNSKPYGRWCLCRSHSSGLRVLILAVGWGCT